MRNRITNLVVSAVMLVTLGVMTAAAFTKTVTIRVEGMKCAKCSSSVTKALKATEGVESEQIRVALEKFGCSEAQGWLFGRAVSADAVRTFLRMSDAGVAPEAGHAAAPSKLRRKG